MPDAGDRSTAGMRRYWDERARANAVWYVDTSLDYSEPDLDRFFATGRAIVADALDGAPAQPAGRELAVEIGSGLGRVCLALADRFDSVVGLDVSPEMVRRARELVPDARVTFEVGDGTSLAPLPDGCADLVVSFTVFQHIPRVAVIRRYLVDAARVLRPGGLLAFQWNSTPGAWRWRVRRAVLGALHDTGLRRERFGRDAAQFLGSRVPVPAVERMLREAGLDPRGTRGDGTLFTWAWAVKR